MAETGTLIVAAVPIGQPGDASARLTEALRSAPLIAAEDTRRARRLANALGIQLAGRVVRQRNRGNVWKFEGEATVAGKLTAEATFAAMILDN